MKTKTATILSASILLWTLSALGQLPDPSAERTIELRPPIEHDVTSETPVAEMTEAEREDYLLTALQDRLPKDTLDDVYLITLNDGEATLPILESYLMNGAEAENLKPKDIYQIADFIAYAGNGEAVETLYRLAKHFESDFFSMRISRLLHYANGRTNPYTLAYKVLDGDDPAMADEALDWVRENAQRGRGFEQLAEAIKLRSMDAYTKEVTLDDDPIVSAIYGRDVPAELWTALGLKPPYSTLAEDE